MKAKATATGYYGGVLRYAGDVFDVPDGESALWFEPIEQPVEDPPAPPDDDPPGIRKLTEAPPEPPPIEAPQEETAEPAAETPAEPQPQADDKPRKSNKPA